MSIAIQSQPEATDILRFAVILAFRYPFAEEHSTLVSQEIGKKLNEYFEPHYRGWCESYAREYPEWNFDQVCQQVSRRIFPASSRFGLALHNLYLLACQEITGNPYLNNYKDFVANEATDFQGPRQIQDLATGSEGWQKLNDGMLRCFGLIYLLNDRGSEVPEFEVGVRGISESIRIRHSAGNEDHRTATRNLIRSADDQSITVTEAKRRTKIAAVYLVLDEFDREFTKRFGTGQGYTKQTFFPDQLRWRDLIHYLTWRCETPISLSCWTRDILTGQAKTPSPAKYILF